MSKTPGIVAAGHEKTAEAAQIILREGGNAFDAALAAMLAACVAEPVLASLGGGGFLLARTGDGQNTLYDFFAQTPLTKPPVSDIDFYPIVADFGAAQQEFHIGLGSIATPGMVRGLFAIHRDLCRLPLDIIMEPAKQAAREGIRLNGFQHYISTVVQPIIDASPASRKLHENACLPGTPAVENDLVINPELADVFDALVTEGEALFYQGELGQRLVGDCREQGGCLSMADLRQYRAQRRKPLEMVYHDATLLTNPPPSIGGTLIAFTLSLLEPEGLGGFRPNTGQHLRLLAHAMRLTQELRWKEAVDQRLNEAMAQHLLGSPLLRAYRHTLKRHAVFSRGTTHISVADAEHNFAGMTLSNGEGSGYVLPGTGIMMNNMLGEEDINPHGFHKWPENRRIASMMSPTLAFAADGRALVIGSGGSNRIRSAIVQVLINLLDFEMNLEDAVEFPRIHFESGLLNLEAGLPQQTLKILLEEFPRQKQWPGKNLFFGGTHCILRDGKGHLHGKGDSRRGGVCLESPR
ncbi:MAG TPA: gamma-glutamyltransferase [Sedimenticola sp.]|nr:gamma-glutamyltransferase [Sedimenticola sp.]